MTKLRKKGPWKKTKLGLHQAVEMSPKIHRAVMLRIGHHFREKIIRAFDTGGRSNKDPWKPNSPLTVFQKKSSKPLIDRGDLRNSTVVVVTGPKRVTVGVSSKAKTDDGDRLVDIAEVHEFGRVIAIRVTYKMFHYVMALISKSGRAGRGSGKPGKPKFKPGAVLVVTIPKRSFLRSTAAAHLSSDKIRKRAEKEFRKLVKLPGRRGAKKPKAK